MTDRNLRRAIWKAERKPKELTASELAHPEVQRTLHDATYSRSFKRNGADGYLELTHGVQRQPKRIYISKLDAAVMDSHSENKYGRGRSNSGKLNDAIVKDSRWNGMWNK